VGNIRTKVPAHNGMPGGVILSIKLLLDKSSNIFFNIVLFERHVSAVDGILLHVFSHVGIFDNGFSFWLVGHFGLMMEVVE